MPHRKKKDTRHAAEIAYRATEKRLRRWRGVSLVLLAIPLVVSLACDTGAIAAACAVPQQVLLGVWAATIGAYLGLTIRLGRERRRFQRSRAG